MDRVLAVVAAAHLAIAVACALWSLRTATPILGLHPAVKPMKFAFSIAIFLATMAWLLPHLALGDAARGLLRWVLALTMLVEMVIIASQAARGRASHFNTQTVFDAAQWRIMALAVIALAVAMIVVAFVATLRPLSLPPLTALATRASLWIFLLSIASGAAMAGRGQHTIGAPDGGSGLPVVDWSIRHGDLRISHFFALHAIQVLPLVAGLRIARSTEVLVLGIVGYAGLVAWTLVRALAGTPPW